MNPWCYFLCTSPAHAHFMHMQIFISLFWYFPWRCFFVSLFLSLSHTLTVCAWHLSANLLRPGTLFNLGHHLLILLLFMSSFVLRRPVRTSWRTFPNVAFIRNATWFYQIFLILLYVRYLWVVPPWWYRSSTPICTILILLYLNLLLMYEVHV